jgi:hypothetical protein
MVLTAATPLGMYGVDKENIWLGHLVEISKHGEINPVKLDLTEAQMLEMQETAKRLDSLYGQDMVQQCVKSAKDRVESTNIQDLVQGVDRGDEPGVKSGR